MFQTKPNGIRISRSGICW